MKCRPSDFSAPKSLPFLLRTWIADPQRHGLSRAQSPFLVSIAAVHPGMPAAPHTVELLDDLPAYGNRGVLLISAVEDDLLPLVGFAGHLTNSQTLWL